MTPPAISEWFSTSCLATSKRQGMSSFFSFWRVIPLERSRSACNRLLTVQLPLEKKCLVPLAPGLSRLTAPPFFLSNKTLYSLSIKDRLLSRTGSVQNQIIYNDLDPKCLKFNGFSPSLYSQKVDPFDIFLLDFTLISFAWKFGNFLIHLIISLTIYIFS